MSAVLVKIHRLARDLGFADRSFASQHLSATSILWLVSFAVLVGVWSAPTRAQNQDPVKEFSDCVILLADLKAISDAYAVDIVDTSHKVRAAKMNWADGIKSTKTAIGQIENRWASYAEAELNTKERAAADEAKALMAKADAATLELISIMTAKDQAALEHFVIEKLYPAIDPVTNAIGKIIDLKIFDCANQDRPSVTE